MVYFVIGHLIFVAIFAAIAGIMSCVELYHVYPELFEDELRETARQAREKYLKQLYKM
jgi:hypothetical protein